MSQGRNTMSEEAKQAQRALQESLDLRDQDHTDA
ncbi:3-isopropylmalate dehydrogenase [Knoellia sinensis]|nr:3-isopropylmalate dehydrogenase [Knoellia sinensis]